MSDAVAIDNPTVADEGQSSAWRQRLAVLDKWLEAAGDRLNPILVKETRQAIKSKQFAITFVLLLMLCWIVTIGGLTLLGPGVYYSAAGGELLKAYMFLLLFPLAVVVPFSAFRSLSSEREENTYDLLRVSTLSPHQIVRGKLGSAAVQMGVYLSAVAPCIAFTYLLRGVDVVTIAVMLLYATLGSLGLAMTSLFMAALAQGKHGQVLLSVGVVTMLLGSFAGSAGLAIAYLDEGRYEVSREELRIFSAGALTFYLTTFALLYLAAVALISYRSENRSTSLRWAMIVQQAAFIGWMAWAWLRFNYEPEGLIVALIIGAIYWYAMGTMLTSESPELSNRVRRRLPQSSMGRLVRGLLNPGPGTGYLFAVACFTGLCLMACAALVYVQYVPLSQRRNYQYPEIIGGMILLWCYLVTYLGVGKLIIAGINRLVPVNAIAGFLLHVIFLMAGAGIPLVIQLSLRSMRNAGYTALQLSNPFWTLGELLEGGGFSDKEIILQSIVLGAVAVCILMVNMPGTAREFMQGRVALPQRVAQDEAELHPVEIKPQNPWEEEAEAAADPDGTEA
ncbi:hypothetical protein NG895_11525 [Aeoliella sp. ICT_H6.2]|uniref:ABC-2 family transporter protein n=1 Tax=Aeoliella straminimaris TaxID=2954799 RepID=A0A9X2FH67_9BACT|nr:hypothetical protein [Aeoliella straminimaris]MCO6044536.1 hypothetical protein [Aeoliella straminimaris]